MGSVGDLTIDFQRREKEDDGGEAEWETEEAVEERGYSSEDGKVFGVELARGWSSRIELWAEEIVGCLEEERKLKSKKEG